MTPRILALLLFGITSLMALPSGASAAVLTSPAETEYTGEFNMTATGTLTLKASVFTATCTTSEVKGTVTTNTTVASGAISTLNLGSCDSTVKTLANGSLELNPSGEVFLKGNEVTTEKFGTSCIYGGAATGTKIGTLTPGTTASLTISASLPKKTGSGVLCAANAAWSGKYTFTTPDTLLVDEVKQFAVLTSPAVTEYTGEFNMTATGTLTLKASVFTATCTIVELNGTVSTNSETQAGVSIAKLHFTGCDSSIKTLRNGSLAINNKGEVFAVENEVTTETGGTSCIYGGAAAGTKLGTLTPGTTASLTVSASLPKKTGSGALCAANAAWSGSFSVTAPDTLLVD